MTIPPSQSIGVARVAAQQDVFQALLREHAMVQLLDFAAINGIDAARAALPDMARRPTVTAFETNLARVSLLTAKEIQFEHWVQCGACGMLHTRVPTDAELNDKSKRGAFLMAQCSAPAEFHKGLTAGACV
jgi:hypothetical protein